MVETAVEDIGKIKLDGITVDEGRKEFYKGFRIVPDKDGKKPKEEPIIERQRRISKNVQDLEGIVKGALGDSIKASKSHAESIAKNLAYEIAKTEGYSGKPEDLNHERILTYLTQAAQATGNPTIGNWTGLIESIMNLPAAKPGDPLYSQNSAIGQLISYIATQKDTESRRLRYLQGRFAELWQKPGIGV